MVAKLPETSVAEHLAGHMVALRAEHLPAQLVGRLGDLLVDVAGLCVAARNEPYIASAIAGYDEAGSATLIGHSLQRSAAAAAFINGTAAHGEDFDDTFEGGPVHAGAVIVPAVLAIAQARQLTGAAALRGIAVGAEVLCRLSLVKPKAIHKAGFHPTAVLGAMAAAAGVGAALGFDRRALVNALGIAGSMASGIIEYLAEGASTKRMHAGWAAQSGMRAALLAHAGFDGPRTVLEGAHGLLHGFAHASDGHWEALTEGFGRHWVIAALAFKPYPCGTKTQPFIDCALQLLARGVRPEDVREMECEVGEGTVHRLWEPLAAKQRPANGYAAKFSTPYCIAAALARGGIGLADFTDQAAANPAVLATAAKVRYAIDPANPYPVNYTGHIRATLNDGRVVEVRQPHLRGGAHEPLTRADIEEKFRRNAHHGGWSDERASAALVALHQQFGAAAIDLSTLKG